jgi:hypothetical protein
MTQQDGGAVAADLTTNPDAAEDRGPRRLLALLTFGGSAFEVLEVETRQARAFLGFLNPALMVL